MNPTDFLSLFQLVRDPSLAMVVVSVSATAYLIPDLDHASTPTVLSNFSPYSYHYRYILCELAI